MYKTPATIRHEGRRPQDYHKGIEYVGRKLGLTPQLTKLLDLYADCKDGFTPAAKFIQDRTGILIGNVARARRCLSRFDIIRYDATKREITVVWPKILEWAQRQPLLNQEEYPDFSRPSSDSFAYYVPDLEKQNDKTDELSSLPIEATEGIDYFVGDAANVYEEESQDSELTPYLF